MAYETIKWEIDGSVGIITLNRPDVLNALIAQSFRDLRDCLVAAEEDPSVRAIVVTGAGRGFCTGADVRRFVGQDGHPLEPPGRTFAHS